MQHQHKHNFLRNIYVFTIKIGGVTVFKRINTKAKYYTNVRVYQADPWYVSANAKIKNLIYQNLQNGM